MTTSAEEKLKQTRQGMRLAEAFVGIDSTVAREAIVVLAEVLAGIKRDN